MLKPVLEQAINISNNAISLKAESAMTLPFYIIFQPGMIDFDVAFMPSLLSSFRTEIYNTV